MEVPDSRMLRACAAAPLGDVKEQVFRPRLTERYAQTCLKKALGMDHFGHHSTFHEPKLLSPRRLAY